MSSIENFRLQHEEFSDDVVLITTEKIEPRCEICRKLIEGEKPYFCPKMHILMHKDCLVDKNHGQFLVDARHSEHSDIPVILAVDTGVKENGD